MRKKVSKREVSRPHCGLAHPLEIRNAALKDYLSGMPRHQVASKYSLPDASILSHWKRKFAPETLQRPSGKMVKPRIKPSRHTDQESYQSQRMAELERALALKEVELQEKEKELERAHVAREIAETMIDIAQEEYDIVIRKNSGTR